MLYQLSHVRTATVPRPEGPVLDALRTLAQGVCRCKTPCGDTSSGPDDIQSTLVTSRVETKISRDQKQGSRVAATGVWCWAGGCAKVRSRTGDWRSGSALRSHRRGHWFEPSIAHSRVGGSLPAPARTPPSVMCFAWTASTTSDRCDHCHAFHRNRSNPRTAARLALTHQTFHNVGRNTLDIAGADHRK